MLLFTLPGKWKHRKQNPDYLCTMHYKTGLYPAGCEDKITVDESVL